MRLQDIVILPCKTGCKSKKKNKEGKEEKGIGHCDVYKGEKEFQYLNNPSDTLFKNQKRYFYYNARGKVFCKDENLNREIGGVIKDDNVEEGIINLNHQYLINKRSGVWNSISRKFKKAAKTERWEQKRQQLLPLARELWEEYSSPKKDKSLYPFSDNLKGSRSPGNEGVQVGSVWSGSTVFLISRTAVCTSNNFTYNPV